MKNPFVAVAIATLSVCAHSAPAPMSPGSYWATSSSDRVNFYDRPNAQGKVVSWDFVGWKVKVFEVKNGFGRVSKSATDHPMWVAMKDLGTEPPPANKAQVGDPPWVKDILDSDNFKKNRAAFIKGTSELIAAGTCKPTDFKDSGGWLQDPNDPTRAKYFMYCGAEDRDHRVWLNVKTGHGYR